MTYAGAAHLRLALLSPYWGGNLGDGAIFQAIIANLKSLHEDTEFLGITLNPGGVRQLHGIAGMNLVSFRRHYYSKSAPLTATPAGTEGASARQRLKAWIARRFPAVYAIARRARAGSTAIVSELVHFVRAVRFIRQTDALIIAGGGQLDEEWGGAWGHPYALFKWSCTARLARRPVIFISVGVAKLDSPLARWFATRVLESAAVVSLRDPWSQAFVETKLLKQPCALRPDLAFSLPVGIPACRPRETPSLTVGVSPIAFGRRGIWPTLAHESSDNYLQVLEEFVSRLLDAGHEVVLFYTDVPDKDISTRLAEAVAQKSSGAAPARLRSVDTATLPQLLELLPTLDLVVASRLHGIILSHVHAIPALAISYDRKVTTHMAQANQAEFCTDLAGLRLAPLLEQFEQLVLHRPECHQTLSRRVEDWRQELSAQYRQVLDCASGQAPAAGTVAEHAPPLHKR